MSPDYTPPQRGNPAAPHSRTGPRTAPLTQGRTRNGDSRRGDTMPPVGSAAGADTVRIPGPLDVPVIRPALAMLYRLAVGPNADHYGARFLAFERAGKPLATWNWPAFLAPPIWAAYRRLWIPALLFALLPLGGALVFLAVNGSVDRAVGLWALCAVLLIWVLPGACAAACADYLVYRRIRRESLAAERDSANPVDAASRVAAWRSVSWYGAAAGVAGMGLIAGAVSHDLLNAWHDHTVRQQVITALANVRSVERDVETNWLTARLVPWQTAALGSSSAARHPVEDVDVSPENGRLRVRFGASVPELNGKAILLAPARDAQQKVRWLCVPVDIPPPYLPPECQRR